MSLETLPNEILLRIFEQLEFNEIYHLRLVKKRFYSFIQSRKLLKVPCSMFWATFSHTGSCRHQCGAMITNEAFALTNSSQKSHTRNYLDDPNIEDTLKYWLDRFAFSGNFDLSVPVLDDKLFALLHKHRSQFRNCKKLNFLSMDIQLSKENIRKLLEMPNQLEQLCIGQCKGTAKIIRLEALDGLNISDIDVVSKEDFTHLDDNFFEKIIQPINKWKQSIGTPCNITLKRLIEFLETGEIKEQRWKFGTLKLGGIAFDDALDKLQQLCSQQKFIAESWSTDGNLFRILIHDEGETRDLHISLEVDTQ